MSISKIKEQIKNDKKLLVMIILGVVGVVLILLSEVGNISTKKEIDVTPQMTNENYENDIENRLKTIISSVEGAGRTEIMITLKSSEENKYASNSTVESQNSDDKSQSKSNYDYVVIDSTSGDSCVLLKTESPQIQGVIVVCDGGDNSKVKSDITNAVSALLGININHISVLKMKSTEE